MNDAETIQRQREERRNCINAIISSKSNKKIILAGAGTGKTYTFREILKNNQNGDNIALTFINSLVNDMASVFGDLAEVKTFHAYCKKILHEQNGRVELFPFLTQIVEEDADYLDLAFEDFDSKFQVLDEDSPEIEFYLRRGDYYDAVSFNDSVYRLYKILEKEPDIIPTFNQILIDEFQDFNPLEVAFINKLESKGPILIVGDDDQSVYESRCASPDYLREKYHSGEYEIFELPFCGRCPQVIVSATNNLLDAAEKAGYLQGRVNKRFECYIYQKGADSIRFPKLHSAQCTTGKVIAKYINKAINEIGVEDIKESWEGDSPYYTVLITGPKQYLTIIQDELSEEHPQMTYKHSDQPNIKITDGYDVLLNDDEANLGWRILIKFYFNRRENSQIIQKSDSGNQLLAILNPNFVQKHKKVLEIIRAIKQDQDFDAHELKKYTGDYCEDIVGYYSPAQKQETVEPDKAKPSILLSSFVGCKGLSAGHVFIVGANDGSIPKDPGDIKNIEIAQFIVALTRTRKQCHIVSNRWHIAPMMKGIFQQAFNKTSFLNWIPSELVDDRGYIRASDI